MWPSLHRSPEVSGLCSGASSPVLAAASVLVVRHSSRRGIVAPLITGEEMATLHIEHPITDLQTWLAACTEFEEARKKAGVRAHRMRQPSTTTSTST